MKFVPNFLYKENELNRVIRSQKREKNKIAILFTSLWDNYSTELVNSINETTEKEGTNKTPLYIVDTFNNPHSSVIFGTTKVPHLVILNKYKTFSEDYLPKIYKELGL